MSVFYPYFQELYFQSSSIHQYLIHSIRRGDGQRVEEEEAQKKSNDDVVIDIKDNDSDTSRNSNEEKLCRICLESSESYQIIELGCDCRGEIGFAHCKCAATWFSFKGNKVCEICGKASKNASSSNNNNNVTITSTTTTMTMSVSLERSERPVVVRVIADSSDEGIPDNKQRIHAVLFMTLFVIVVIVYLGSITYA